MKLRDAAEAIIVAILLIAMLAFCFRIGAASHQAEAERSEVE
jgi:hypothetical protein